MKEAKKAISSFASTYGMLAVLGLLCLFFSWSTYRVESPTGSAGATLLTEQISREAPKGADIVIVTSAEPDSVEFTVILSESLRKAGYSIQAAAKGDPPQIRAELEALAAGGKPVKWIATTRSIQEWSLWDSLRSSSPAFKETRILAPGNIHRSIFLSAGNLRNVADQIAVIAILAVGMTLVIITGGIDLSVGSLLALSAVLTAWLIQKWGGGNAGIGAMVGASLLAIALCGAVGGFSGWLIARFNVPPFIVTLAGMQIASGLAFMVAKGQSIYDIPVAFTGLGRGGAIATIPNAVLLMLALYIAANFFMMRSTIGRNIYAIGGNKEAARLSGVSVRRTLIIVYVVCALMAGIGGVITASQLRAGAPTYGAMYEMYAIAAVVVGGTSLTGGQGRIFGTLIGALVIAVIRNGMNLMDVEPYTQKVLLGVVILAAVLADMLRRHGSARKADQKS